MPLIRVLVVDDHPDMVAAIVSVLDDDPRFGVSGTARTGDEALDLLRTAPVDVVLLDVNMPGGGPAVAEAVRNLDDPPVVVALSAHSGSASVEAMVRAGAMGYLTKGHAGDHLGDCIARCAAGEVILATPAAATALRSLLRAVQHA